MTVAIALAVGMVAQAVERADTKKFNRGGEAAKSAIEMVAVMRKIRGNVEKLENRTSSSQNQRAVGRAKR